MAGSKRPSFLKRQKEQARLARATEKREARRAKKHAKANGLDQPEGADGDLDMDPMVEGEGDIDSDIDSDIEGDIEGEDPPPEKV